MRGLVEVTLCSTTTRLIGDFTEQQRKAIGPVSTITECTPRTTICRIGCRHW